MGRVLGVEGTAHTKTTVEVSMETPDRYVVVYVHEDIKIVRFEKALRDGGMDVSMTNGRLLVDEGREGDDAK